MKYHKIRNIPLDVCTAEQMIAYNIAFANYDWIRTRCFDNWRDEIRTIIRRYKTDPKFKRYDMDLVQSALLAGFEQYARYPFIASDYERIGKAFPALYLDKQEGSVTQ